MTSLDCEERVQMPATHHMTRAGGSELRAAWSREAPVSPGLGTWAGHS